MKNAYFFKTLFFAFLAKKWELSAEDLTSIDVVLNVDAEKREHGDLSSNAAMVIAKKRRVAPRVISLEIIADLRLESSFEEARELAQHLALVEIAGPGFLNFRLKKESWGFLVKELFADFNRFFIPEQLKKEKMLIEFVSANPTGPLHLGHGRGGIVGDTLVRVGRFLGHEVHSEFYINDAGSQMIRLGESLKARVWHVFGKAAEIPENGYHGEYLIAIAEEAKEMHGEALLEKPLEFFVTLAREKLLSIIKKNLSDYQITFDQWFSELSLYKSGAVEAAIELLRSKGLVYEKEGALWFLATSFGDDKDRVIKKSDGELTYIAADIAYHKNKFDRGYTKIIDILGQDHHGYVKRLKATMAALEYDAEVLDVILYQLVSMKKNDELVKMSKRAGNFEQLGQVIELVGPDVARFFYLHRKAEAHLEFDLEVALKKNDENPVFYIHYAYVRTGSILARAEKNSQLFEAYTQARFGSEKALFDAIALLDVDEQLLLKKIWSLHSILHSVVDSYQTHVLAYYTLELAQKFHHYYAQHHVIDEEKKELSVARLLMVSVVRSTLSLCLDLLGLSKPEAM
jgi:arginyl-tRNA synthetase